MRHAFGLKLGRTNSVILDVDGEPPVLPVRERGPQRGGRVVTHAGSAGAADALIILVKGPQPPRPVARGAGG